jgi:hypothetical protein
MRKAVLEKCFKESQSLNADCDNLKPGQQCQDKLRLIRPMQNNKKKLFYVLPATHIVSTIHIVSFAQLMSGAPPTQRGHD